MLSNPKEYEKNLSSNFNFYSFRSESSVESEGNEAHSVPSFVKSATEHEQKLRKWLLLTKRVEEKKNNNHNLSIEKIKFDESVSDSEEDFDCTHKNKLEDLD